MLLCAVSICICKWEDWWKLLLHSEHVYGLSPVWTLMWVLRCEDCLKALSHTWHLYGFSLLWILLCITRLPACENRLLQKVHSNGFSPEWIRLCSVKTELFTQILPHSLHLYFLVWDFMCTFNKCRCGKCFSHWEHEYKLPPLCRLLWTNKSVFLVNRLSHTVHWNGFSPLWSLLWAFRVPFCKNRLSHTVHWKGFSPVCLCWWIFKCCFVLNDLSHNVHTYGLDLSSCLCSMTPVSPEWYTQHQTLSKCYVQSRH